MATVNSNSSLTPVKEGSASFSEPENEPDTRTSLYGLAVNERTDSVQAMDGFHGASDGELRSEFTVKAEMKLQASGQPGLFYVISPERTSVNPTNRTNGSEAVTTAFTKPEKLSKGQKKKEKQRRKKGKSGNEGQLPISVANKKSEDSRRAFLGAINDPKKLISSAMDEAMSGQSDHQRSASKRLMLKQRVTNSIANKKRFRAGGESLFIDVNDEADIGQNLTAISEEFIVLRRAIQENEMRVEAARARFYFLKNAYDFYLSSHPDEERCLLIRGCISAAQLCLHLQILTLIQIGLAEYEPMSSSRIQSHILNYLAKESIPLFHLPKYAADGLFRPVIEQMNITVRMVGVHGLLTASQLEDCLVKHEKFPCVQQLALNIIIIANTIIDILDQQISQQVCQQQDKDIASQDIRVRIFNLLYPFLGLMDVFWSEEANVTEHCPAYYWQHRFEFSVLCNEVGTLPLVMEQLNQWPEYQFNFTPITDSLLFFTRSFECLKTLTVGTSSMSLPLVYCLSAIITSFETGFISRMGIDITFGYQEILTELSVKLQSCDGSDKLAMVAHLKEIKLKFAFATLVASAQSVKAELEVETLRLSTQACELAAKHQAYLLELQTSLLTSSTKHTLDKAKYSTLKVPKNKARPKSIDEIKVDTKVQVTEPTIAENKDEEALPLDPDLEMLIRTQHQDLHQALFELNKLGQKSRDPLSRQVAYLSILENVFRLGIKNVEL
ncbi:MAG: hypothetical protein ACPGUD_13570, partial [Parashewanella sp.]